MNPNDNDDVPEAASCRKRPADDAAAAVTAAAAKPNRVKKKNMDPAILRFRGCVQQCCKRDDLATAMEAYQRAVVAQTRIEPQSFYSLLNLCDGLGERGIHVGTPKAPRETADKQQDSQEKTNEIDDTARRLFAERIKKHMDDLQLPLTENAYTAIVRLFCRTNDITEAERVLAEAEQTQQCKVKIRLYAPLLATYCQQGDLVNAVRTWHRLSTKGLVLTETEYCALIQCCTRTGDVAVFERILSDLAEDVLVPSHETTKAVTQWFGSPYAVLSPESATDESTAETASRTKTKELLPQIQVPYQQTVTTMGPVQCADTAGWTVSHKCQVDTTTGELLTGCLQGASLQPTSLTEQAWQDMKRMNEAIAVTGKLSDNDTTNYQGGGKGRKFTVDSKAIEERQFHWKALQDYLDHRSAEKPVDVLIDGANVGYFEQNFAGPPKHVDYAQIDWVVQHFVRLHKSVLLVMHSRHFARKLMPRSAEPLMQKWLDEGLLYRTPPGMNDDWFWLHAALHSGPGTLVVTNDEMRDHHFQMVAPRSFLRWKDRHQIHFEFGGWQKDAQGQSMGREVKLAYPDRYSRRIQRVLNGLVVPLPKRGDTNRFLDGAFVADVETEDELYLCIRPKSGDAGIL